MALPIPVIWHIPSITSLSLLLPVSLARIAIPLESATITG
jgi:hypothetical protein